MPAETDINYTVVITATARAAIREQVRFIADDQQSPLNAADWLSRTRTAIETLHFLPRRFPPAEGYENTPYVIRRIIIDNHLILSTIDDASTTVYIVGLRHGAKLPHPTDIDPLPPPSLRSPSCPP